MKTMPNNTSSSPASAGFTTAPKGTKVTKKALLAHNIIDEHKAEWLWHEAKRKVVIGGKGTGKTHPVKLKELWLMETFKDANTFDFRKYKESATTTMSGAMLYAVRDLAGWGFDVTDYRRSMNNLYKLDDKKTMDNNQKQRYAALEDPTSTDGQAPSNGGFYGIIHIDEPVVKDDVLNPDKIPTKEKFETDMKIIRENLSRFNDPYMMRKSLTKPPHYEEFFTMNPWGTHPLIVEAGEFFPEDEYIEWKFGYLIDDIIGDQNLIDKLFASQDWVDRVQSRHTMSKYQASTDTLFVRMDKWANPMNRLPQKSEQLFKDLKKAFEEGNRREIMIMIGTLYEEELDARELVFHIDDYNETDPAVYDDKWEKIAVNYSVDVDTSRVFTITPTILYRKAVGISPTKQFKYKHEVFVDQIIEIKATGTGEFGEMNDIYVKAIEEVVSKHYWSKVKSTTKGVIISVDDKRKWYLNELRKLKIPFVNKYRSFQQHGDWAIAARQDMVTAGLEQGAIKIHEKNKHLIQDMKSCTKADINKPERKTSGRTNYLDRIDSMENGVIPFASVFWKRRL